ncbi:AAA family ATPase [Bacillus thuringiensis]
MANYGEMIISKVIDNNDVSAFGRFNITEADFVTAAEREAYNFLIEYSNKNRGNVPDYRTVVSMVDGFNYRPEVSDSFEFMSLQMKEYSTQLRVQELMQTKVMQKFEEETGLAFTRWLRDELEHIEQQANYRTKVGTDLVADSMNFWLEYEKRKGGESFKIWNSAFPTINKVIGGYLSGNVYTWYGRSGRGKSVFTMVEALEAALQGATVLIWAMEMSKYEWLSRAYSYISAKAELVNAEVNGEEYLAGFATNQLLIGCLENEEWEKGFQSFLKNLNTIIKGRLIIRAVDDADFYNRGCQQLEADILQTKADVVVIDPIYYMDYERNTSNVAGGDVANTSKKIRHIAGHTKAVIHVITQAEEVRDDKDESKQRILRAPERAEIKKTKAVLEDATNTFGIDSVDGRFLIKIGKGRNGGEGTEIEGLYLPAIGLIKEYEKKEMAEQFGF